MARQVVKLSDCERWFNWVEKLRVTYQPVKGFEHKIEEERIKGFERILKTITDHCGDVTGKSFLDIGSNLGYFCFHLTELGAQTTGIELDNRRTEFCKCIAARDGFDPANPYFLNGNVVEFVDNTSETFDYVLLLNVFHHILVHDEPGGWAMFNKLINIVDGIFVMMRNSYRYWSLCSHPRQIPEAIVATTSATNYKAYPPVHGRVIYVFWKE